MERHIRLNGNIYAVAAAAAITAAVVVFATVVAFIPYIQSVE